MKINICILFISLLLCTVQTIGQTAFSETTIDGSLSTEELNESVGWKIVSKTDHVLVKESESSFYIAIQSNVNTSANVFIRKENTVWVLHASYSLGDVLYTKHVSDWRPSENEFYWKFRDPLLRDAEKIPDLKTEILELYNPKLEVRDEITEFYKNNRWAANTMPLGIENEMEFLISKKLLNNISELFIAYISEDENGKVILTYFPENIVSLTSDPKMDSELQNGNVPKKLVFTF